MSSVMIVGSQIMAETLSCKDSDMLQRLSMNGISTTTSIVTSLNRSPSQRLFVDVVTGYASATSKTMHASLWIVIVGTYLINNSVLGYLSCSRRPSGITALRQLNPPLRAMRRNCAAATSLDQSLLTIEENSTKGAASTTAVLVPGNDNSVLMRLIGLLSPGEGQSHGNRSALHASNTTRSMSDPQMWTHIFFFINGYMAYQNKLYDLFLLTLITTPLSMAYHYSFEKPGKLAQLEGIAAKSLFVYGLTQIFRAPTMSLALLESFFLFLTISVFIGTNFRPKLYEPYHCFMHIIPPLWATIVAVTHTPIFKMF